MNGYQLFTSLRFLMIIPLFVFIGIFSCAWFVWHEVSLEKSYHQRFGDGWQAHYETDQGSLAVAHRKIGVSVFGILSITGISVWLIRHLTDQQPKVAKKSRHRYGSSVERIIHFRRNALVGVSFGIIGILLSLVLVLFHIGLFTQHDNERVLGIFIFIAGYSAVISGCWWWTKAKGWNEAVVFIGFLPITILFVPFIRLIVLATPLVLPVSMVMAPIILTVVVAVLPDKSGLPPKKRWKLRP